MFDIEKWHNDTINDLRRLAKLALENIDEDMGASFQIEIGMATQEIEKAIDEAKLYKIHKLKCSQGGKKSAKNMTKEERIKRATLAGSSKNRSIYGDFIATDENEKTKSDGKIY